MFKKLIAAMFTFCLLGIVNAAEMPSPYCDIKVLPFDKHGFYGNAKHIEALVREHSVQTIIEVGCWMGTSTRHMATLLPEGGKVYAVDHWLGSEDIFPLQCYKKRKGILYQQFLSNVIHAELTDKIVPVRMESLEAARALDVQPDLIYVDAAHDMESVYKDLKAWYPKVKGHGVLCGDDWRWGKGLPVKKAVLKFAKEKKLKAVSPPGSNFWYLVE